MSKTVIILVGLFIILVIVGLVWLFKPKEKYNKIENTNLQASATNPRTPTGPCSPKIDKESVVLSFHNDGIQLKVTRELEHQFSDRIDAEKKFRTITRQLINHGIIDAKKNIIDLGAWIGDNSLVWSKMIDGTVYAIDPSPDNIKIIHTLQDLNEIENITTITKPISSKIENVEVSEGDINHASFKASTKGISTETLDNLYNNNIIDNIGFIHLDVEGFEYKVLEASQKIISRFRPIIVTESHSEDKDVEPLIVKHGYTKYLIDEICGSNPSCRNCLWIPDELTFRIKGLELDGIDTSQ